jgi:membrane-associated phospholipid phosphatase
MWQAIDLSQSRQRSKIAISAMTKAQKHKIRKILRHPTTQLILAVALFVVSCILVRDGKLAAWEKIVFQFFFDLPEALSPVFWTITQFGGVGVLLAISIIFLIVKRYAIVIEMLIAGLLAELLAHVGKGMFGRPRPVEYFVDLVTRDEFISGPGFPSGHTAVATAMALVTWHYLPKGYKWISVVWIVGVAASRMYLGVHAPMDLVGGFAIGWACVAIVKHVKMKDIR